MAVLVRVTISNSLMRKAGWMLGIAEKRVTNAKGDMVDTGDLRGQAMMYDAAVDGSRGVQIAMLVEMSKKEHEDVVDG